MSSAFERLQKIAHQKKESEKEKLSLELVSSVSSNISNAKNSDIFSNIPNQLNIDNQLYQLSLPNIDNQPNQPNTNQSNYNKKAPLKMRQAVSPDRDFTKVPNSVTRDIVPERLFKGLSKHTYDALYLKTRGAINPVREIRATKSDILRWTGISDVTLDKHLKHLRSVGLVNWKFIIGSHDGNLYEVFVPEEIDLDYIANLTNLNPTNITNKVGGDITNFVGDVGGVQNYENKALNLAPKTSLKTNTKNDDEGAGASAPFALLNARLDAAVQKLTGKPASAVEAEKWGSLAELLVLEMETAAARTGTISSVPAFLTEVLRRKLFGGNTPASSRTSKSKPDTVGRPNAEGEYEKKPLDAAGREATLLELKDFAGEDFLPAFEKWYTPADWRWLSAELEKLKS